MNLLSVYCVNPLTLQNVKRLLLPIPSMWEFVAFFRFQHFSIVHFYYPSSHSSRSQLNRCMFTVWTAGGAAHRQDIQQPAGLQPSHMGDPEFTLLFLKRSLTSFDKHWILISTKWGILKRAKNILNFSVIHCPDFIILITVWKHKHQIWEEGAAIRAGQMKCVEKSKAWSAWQQLIHSMCFVSEMQCAVLR